MANTITLINDVKARCQLRNDSTYDVSILGWLNRGQESWSTRFLWDFLRAEETVTTDSTTQNYALEAPCLVYNVRNTSTNQPLSYIRDIEMDQFESNGASTGSPIRFRMQGQYKSSASSTPLPYIQFWPQPDAAYTIKVRSYRYMSDLADNTDVSAIPAAYHEFLTHYACNIYFSSIGDQRATSHYDQSENIIMTAVEQLGAVPTSQIDVLRSSDTMYEVGEVRFPSSFPDYYSR